MKRIYLHIGQFKTGTSAIQQFCNDNREMLLALGVDYLSTARPANNPTNHGKLSLSLFTRFAEKIPEWYDDADSFADVAEAVRNEIEISDCTRIIVSSEEFYRYARLDQESASTAISELQSVFAGYDVRVIMYVRAPLDFMKSWYNQLNKAPVPRRRFTDVFYFLDDSMLIPRITADFWRECFGRDCLILSPFIGESQGHIARFFKLLDIELPESCPLPEDLVNEKRNEADMEIDRMRKILALDDLEKQHKYLNSAVLASDAAFASLEQKVARVRDSFREFCTEEGLIFPESEFSVADLLIHEERVNSKDVVLCRDLWPAPPTAETGPEPESEPQPEPQP